MEEKYVLVTTEFRGVFFGRLVSVDRDEFGTRVRLKDAQNAVYWSTETRGFMGLAATGPDENCRIGPIVPSLCLEKVTSIVTCTDDAVAAWKQTPWKQ